MTHPLDGPRAKIGRAEKHLAEFDSARELWLESNPYAVFPNPNADKTSWKFMLHRFDDPLKLESDLFGLIIGDYVHALRSALDHLVWQLVTVANGVTPKSEPEVSFPIVVKHPKDFWARPIVARQELTLEQALMIESFQPYRAIGMEKTTPLADLHALWNADKHKVITPVKVTFAKERPPLFRTNEDARFVGGEVDTDIPLVGDAEIGWAEIEVIGPDPKVDMHRFSVDVAFGESGRLIESLSALHTVTRNIVENCAHFFE